MILPMASKNFRMSKVYFWLNTFDVLKIPMASKNFRTSKVFFDDFWLSTFFLTVLIFDVLIGMMISMLWSSSIFVTFDVLISLINTFDVLINQSTFRLSMFFFRLSTKWFLTYWPFPKLYTKNIKNQTRLHLGTFNKLTFRWALVTVDYIKKLKIKLENYLQNYPVWNPFQNITLQTILILASF
jgi:hypothetical protein